MYPVMESLEVGVKARLDTKFGCWGTAPTTATDAFPVCDFMEMGDKAFVDGTGTHACLKKYLTVPITYPAMEALATCGQAVYDSGRGGWINAPSKVTDAVPICEAIGIGDQAYVENLSGAKCLKKYIAPDTINESTYPASEAHHFGGQA